MYSRSPENGNVLSETESQGLRKTKGFGPKSPETGARSFGKCTPEPEGHFVPEVLSQDGKKGQPEGSAVTGRT
jgi:hypothetical protein